MVSFVALALALLLTIFLANSFAGEQAHQWHAHFGRMRRRKGGGWQYREMTPEEVREDIDERAW